MQKKQTKKKIDLVGSGEYGALSQKTKSMSESASSFEI